MKNTIIATAALLAGSLYSQAQTTSVATEPVGFVSVTVPAASDAAVGAPLAQASVYQGVIQSISGTGPSYVITAAGTTGWTTGQFVFAQGTQNSYYYVQIATGNREGLVAMVTANDSSTITVTVPTGDDLNNVSTNAAPISPATTGDSITIVPYWTLPTLITGVPNGTQAILYPTNVAGTNLSGTLYTLTSNGWKQGSTDATYTYLPPYQGFTLRNNSASAITVSITGSVPMATSRMILRTINAGVSQDQRIFFNSPVPEYLSNTDLGINPGDALYVIDNTATGKNKSGVKIQWTGSKWLQGGTDVTSTYQLLPGTSYILRKIQTSSPGTVVSSGLQSYLQ